ncbi:MAG: hypothetical protein KatS3mg045_2020 [Bellilinea sp.]|nr:MAG: hypothetical protein KatS3mg045_2020 [Bellilinea sp.]
MKKNLFVVALISILVVVSMAACTRSATTKQPGEATATSEIPFPISTVDPNQRLTEIVQQTQAAQQPTAQPQEITPETPGEATPIIVVTDTPVPQPHYHSAGFANPQPPGNLHPAKRRMANLHRPALQSGSQRFLLRQQPQHEFPPG